MNIRELLDSFGFPVFIATYLLVIITRKIDKLTEVVKMLVMLHQQKGGDGSV